MQRYIPFALDEYYHAYSRGTEKRKTFLNENDYFRFILLLYLCNSKENIQLSRIFESIKTKNKNSGKEAPYLSKKDLYELFDMSIKNKLVSIVSYCLMPNHFHLILREVKEGGISMFMKKLLTAYSMYFNIKYERSGALFTRPFRLKNINKDNYFRCLFSYVHLNPIKIIDSKWKKQGIRDVKKAKIFLNNYKYSSYLDFIGKDRPEKKILSFKDVPDYFSGTKDFQDFVESWLETSFLYINEENDSR